MSEPKPRRVAVWVKGVLAVSLAVNLLIVGLVAGFFLSTGPGGDDRSRALTTLGLGPFAVALTREDREALLARIDREAQRGARREIGGAMRDLGAILRSEPFDRDAASAVLRQTRGAAERLQAQGHDALLDQLQAMTPEARRALSERLQRTLRRMSERGGD